MPKLYLGEALGLIGKTMPFIWVRLGSYLLLGLGLGLYFAVIGGLSWVLGSLWAPLGWIVFLIAIGGAWGIVRWVTKYYFYLLKAAHTSVMTEFIVTGSGPSGSQIDYGRKQVTDRFRDTSILFAVDQLVDGVVKAFVRSFVRIVDILPIPGIDSLGKLLHRVALMSTTYIDESILSRAYKDREPNVWKTAHDGVTLYAQAWKPILANAVVLALIGYVEFIVLLLIFGLPAAAIGAVFPGSGVALAIAVIILAWMVKLAVADAFSLATTLIAYHRSTESLEVNEGWKGRLEGVSGKFRELGKKAAEGISSQMPRAATDAQSFTPAGAGASSGGVGPQASHVAADGAQDDEADEDLRSPRHSRPPAEDCVRKFLIGRLAVFALLFVTGGLVAYVVLWRPVQQVIQTFRELERVEELSDRVRDDSPYRPPANGFLAEEQLDRYLAVQRGRRDRSEAVSDPASPIQSTAFTLTSGLGVWVPEMVMSAFR